MNDKTVAVDQLKVLKQKLETAINSRVMIEEDFKTQSSSLIQFISKISLVCKGIDLELDNRLANLRQLLTKSAPFTEIEKQISVISTLLKQHSTKNEQSIREMHAQLQSAGKSLQKTSGLSKKLTSDLRNLLKETEESKEAMIQYVPLLSKLLSFYDFALKEKSAPPKGGLLNKSPQVQQNTFEEPSSEHVNKETFDKLSQLLNSLTLSIKQDKQLAQIKSKLDAEMTHDKLLLSFIDIFNLVVEDLKLERNTSKSFLSTLSETLSTVQNAVKTTLSTCTKSNAHHELLNDQLQQQISDMNGSVDNATSLAEIKNDINTKLQLIAGTLDKKVTFEQVCQKSLEKQLTDMEDKVKHLEKQSQTFEKKIKEQQIKSMQDSLTKLGNRAAFDDYFAKSIVRYHHKPFELALVVIDLDDFKRINDNYGHTAGDKTLQVIANTLTKVISKDVFIGRYGGEEFVLIYSNRDQEKIVSELESIRKKIARLPFKFRDNRVSITLSIGVSHINQADNIHTAFERADKALYQAKEQGKNQVVYI